MLHSLSSQTNIFPLLPLTSSIYFPHSGHLFLVKLSCLNLLSLFFISLTTIIGLLSNQSQMIGFWVSGGFRNVTWQDFRLIFIVGVIGLIIAMILSPKINILTFIFRRDF